LTDARIAANYNAGLYARGRAVVAEGAHEFRRSGSFPLAASSPRDGASSVVGASTDSVRISPCRLQVVRHAQDHETRRKQESFYQSSAAADFRSDWLLAPSTLWKYLSFPEGAHDEEKD